MTKPTTDQIHERTGRYFSDSGLGRLQGATVSVIGAGGVGTEVCKNLVMLGIARLLVCDPDKVSASNLNRGVFFRPGDVDRMAKVHAVKRGLKALGLSTQVEAFARPVQEMDEAFWDADLMVCCVDNDTARLWANLQMLGAERFIPCVSGAVGRGVVEVKTLVPGRTACLCCGWSKEHYEELIRENVAEHCDEFFMSTRTSFPQISPLSSLVAAVMTYRAASLLSEGKDAVEQGRSTQIDLENGRRSFDGEFCRNKACVEPLCRAE